MYASASTPIPPVGVTGAARTERGGEPPMTETAMTLAFVGDVMLGRGVSAMFSSRAPESFWGDVLPVMRSAGAVIANLESPITEAASEWHRTWKAFRFRASPAAVEVLRAGNIRCVNLANNHALDYGEDGLIETLERLDAAGIVHAGAGRDLADAIRPALFDVAGARVGVIGLTDNMSEFAARRRQPGTNVLRIDDRNVTLGLIDLLVRDLRRAGAGTVVLSVHWGPNLRTWPPMRFRHFARAAVELGIDIVHGHSAHLFQGVEKWGDGLILYDTGDFLDDYWVFPGVRIDRSFIFVVEVRNGRPGRLIMRPVMLAHGRVGFAKGVEFAATVATMRRRCRRFATPLVANGDGLLMTFPSDPENASGTPQPSVDCGIRERGLSPTRRADRC
jgi:poly-gamma-glutamate capsule biosynthesis protein CapA/YwtB (metallophosphatase superfamily)